MNKKMNNKGFSLVELIVVIAIMAILVGALAPQFIKYVEKSRQSTDIQNIAEMKSAVEIYVADKESPDASYTVTLTTSNASIDASVAANAGIESTVSLKSGGWSASSATYSTSNYTWTVSTGTQNSKAPSSDYKSVFNK